MDMQVAMFKAIAYYIQATYKVWEINYNWPF